MIFSIPIGIIYPFYWFTQTQEFQIMGNMEIFGFKAQGVVSAENIVGRKFRFYDGNYTIFANCGDCNIVSLIVLKGKEKGSASYDTTLFNASGKLSVTANNVSFFSCEILSGNSTGLAHFINKETEIYLPFRNYPINDVLLWFKSNISDTISVSLLNGIYEIFLDFVAFEGTVEITGNNNFTLTLETDRAGILLTVYVPRNRNYNINVLGKHKHLYIQDWKILGIEFIRKIEKFNSLKLYYAKGEFTIEEKSYDAIGSQHLIFTDFGGEVYILPSSDLGLFRVLMGGRIKSALSESCGKLSDITGKSIFDILPIIYFGLAPLIFGIMKYLDIESWLNVKKEVILLIFAIFGSLCCFLWAIKTEQATVFQQFLGYLSFSLISAAITYYALKGKE